jgi:hypothetical protein
VAAFGQHPTSIRLSTGEADRREVDPPVQVHVATWVGGRDGRLVGPRTPGWFGRVRGRDGKQRWIKAVDLRPRHSRLVRSSSCHPPLDHLVAAIAKSVVNDVDGGPKVGQCLTLQQTWRDVEQPGGLVDGGHFILGAWVVPHHVLTLRIVGERFSQHCPLVTSALPATA